MSTAKGKNKRRGLVFRTEREYFCIKKKQHKRRRHHGKIQKHFRENRRENRKYEPVYNERRAASDTQKAEQQEAKQRGAGGVGNGICHDNGGKEAVIHFEKGDTSHVGIYARINQLFVHDHLQGTEYVNRQEDMGLEGLRKAKLSYHPDLMQEKVKAWLK